MVSKRQNNFDSLWNICVKPYRVLFIIGHQWKDPEGFAIECQWNIPFDFTSGDMGECEFAQIAALLKSWCIPFDILRLDQNELKIEHFLDEEMKAKYGCILWNADQSEMEDIDYSVLNRVVVEYGISLIAISNRIQEPIICQLLGLEYLGCYAHSSRLEVTADHFLTRGMVGVSIPEEKKSPYQKRVQVRVADAQVLAVQGGFPQITVKDISEDTKTVWIGGDYGIMFDWYLEIRSLLRRAITWCIGYSIYKTYPNTVIMAMDDPGSAQNTYLEHWHYPTLTRDQIRERIIAPLKECGAMMVINVCPGFPDVETRQIIPSWSKKFVDPFGTLQDYPSTKEGIDEGLGLGVFEIQSHGWTHMHPDLSDPSCPWWDADTEGEKAEVRWYREFGDVRKGVDIPAEIQRLHMKRSIEGIESQFNVTPLAIRPGGAGISSAPQNRTSILSALEGFGWCGGSQGAFCSRDLVIENMNGMIGTKENPREKADDAPRIIDAPPDGHDREVALYKNGFAWGLKKLVGHHFMGLNEYIGYLHAKIKVTGGDEFRIDIEYDSHYCQYVRRHSSGWIFHLSDRLYEKLGLPDHLQILINGEENHTQPLTRDRNHEQKYIKTNTLKEKIKKLPSSLWKATAETAGEVNGRSPQTSLYADEMIQIQLPPGAGRHTIKLKPKA